MTSPETVSEAEVEAAARALYEHEPEMNMGEPIRWRDLADHFAHRCRLRARAALTAAAQVRAQAFVPKPLSAEIEDARKDFARALAKNFTPWK